MGGWMHLWILECMRGRQRVLSFQHLFCSSLTNLTRASHDRVLDYSMVFDDMSSNGSLSGITGKHYAFVCPVK